MQDCHLYRELERRIEAFFTWQSFRTTAPRFLQLLYWFLNNSLNEERGISSSQVRFSKSALASERTFFIEPRIVSRTFLTPTATRHMLASKNSSKSCASSHSEELFKNQYNSCKNLGVKVDFDTARRVWMRAITRDREGIDFLLMALENPRVVSAIDEENLFDFVLRYCETVKKYIKHKTLSTTTIAAIRRQSKAVTTVIAKYIMQTINEEYSPNMYTADVLSKGDNSGNVSISSM